MPNTKKKSVQSAALAEKIVVHDHDVLNGRGVNIAQHPGNLRFRALVKSHADQSYCSDYSTSAKKAVAEEIIHHIQNLDPPGRFLKRPSRVKKSDVEGGNWEELTPKETLKKTCQALRDCNRGDRAEYARHIQAPEDVKVSKEHREQSGLSNREYAEQIAAATSIRIIPPPLPVAATSASAHRNELRVDTSAVSRLEQPEQGKTVLETPTQPTTTPATVASSGGFQSFQEQEQPDAASLGGVAPEDHHNVSAVQLPFADHFTNSPTQADGLDYHHFDMEEEQKLAAMARESANFDGDFDEGCRESAEAILGRHLDESTDFTTVFDGDITI